MEIPFKERYIEFASDNITNKTAKGNKNEIWIRSIILIAMILPIALLSHNMAVVVDFGVNAANP